MKLGSRRSSGVALGLSALARSRIVERIPSRVRWEASWGLTTGNSRSGDVRRVGVARVATGAGGEAQERPNQLFDLQVNPEQDKRPQADRQ
jgi:hypothetical protein